MNESFFLPGSASRARLREAENARKNRAEIVKAFSQGKVSRRELIKWGLITTAGTLAPISGLSPFARSVYADDVNIPTGAPPSPLFGALPFTQPMPRFDVLPRDPVSALNPAPMVEANQTQQPVPASLGGGMGPIEGRPPGAAWAHQQFDLLPPQVSISASIEGAKVNTVYNPLVTSDFNSGIDAATPFPPKFHPLMPDQGPLAFWTYQGTFPPKLMQVRYGGDAVLFRLSNKLPADFTQNGGFGRITTTTHEHNGHHGAENDGFTGAYFFPGQFYDYHYPVVLAGRNSINTDATDPRASGPADNGGLNKISGDWRETMSTHWFHDHMFSFTSQDVYKGEAGMFNIYSGLDRGNEELDDGVNLRLPSGTAKGWGNLEYDINLMLADKAWDTDGQLFFDIFDFDGFLGDAMTVNLVYKPFFEVERRKYRFRILNGAVSRFFKVCLTDSTNNELPFFFIANDGNLMPSPVILTELDEQGIAERYDIVFDFSSHKIGDKIWMVNLCEHQNGKRPHDDLTLSEALSGNSADPCIGKFLEFRVVRDPAQPDVSQVPSVMIPNPDLSNIPVVRTRTFEFGDNATQDTNDPVTTFFGPWGIRTDDQGLRADADFGRISAAPKFGTREVWTIVNNGGGWDHPIHIHFEEGHITARNGSASNVPSWEKGRKDVYRLRPGGSVTLTIQFRDFGGMFMEHCHNTVHEDNAMLLRWDISKVGAPFLDPLPTPIPTPQGVKFEPPDDILPTAF